MLLKNKDLLLTRFKNPLVLIGSIIGVILLFFLFNGLILIKSFFIEGGLFFSTNNITLFRELIWRNYAFITLPAIVGIGMILKKKWQWGIALLILLALYTYLWNFKLMSPRIRYLIPLFGILFVFYGVFWGKVAAEFFPKSKTLFIILLIVTLYAGGYKIIRKPNAYYSPNADLVADVQNADYKTFFQHVQKKYPDLENTAVFTNWGDTLYWYMPGVEIDAYFRKGSFDQNPKPSNIDGKMVYGSFDQFIAEMEKHEQGLLIVEDWESLLPEEIKKYAKEHLKRELRVESMDVSRTDNWPLELYSWGFEEERGIDL